MIKLQLLSTMLLVIVQLAVSQQPTYYLDPNKKLYQYNLETWSTDNGLPTNSLLSICQSSSGYLWIGSYDGLIRFDGHDFKLYHQYNTPELKSNTIRKIVESEDGTLWMTTQGSGLLAFKDDKIKAYGLEQNISNLYRALYVDKEQRVWSASPERGWFVFDKGVFKFLDNSENLKNIEIRSITEDNDGVIWFGTLGKGIYAYKNNEFKVYNKNNGLINNWVYSIYVDSKGKIWAGTNLGISYFNNQSFVDLPIKNVGTVNDILEDLYGNIWFSSTTGIYRINSINQEVEHLDSKRGLRHNFINNIIFDKEGNLWMTNYKGGLSQLKDGKFTNYTAIGGLHGKVVNAICELDTNKYVAAFDNGELSLIDNGKIRRYLTHAGLSGKRIRHILKDSKDNLWISTYSGLLKATKDGRLKWYKKSNGFPAGQIRLTYEDSKGRIWVGSRNGGLVRMNSDNTYSIYNVSNGLSANLIMSIEEADNGRMLIGTSEGSAGLNILLENDSIISYSNQDGLIGEVVFNTYTDTLGFTWIASNKGLSCLIDGEIIVYAIAEGALNDIPFDILEDDAGYFWLPCSKGVMRVQREELLTLQDIKGAVFRCDLFNKYDGMNQSECNPTTKSLKASDGTLLFPTIDGIAQINPMNIPVNNFIPPVEIQDVFVDGHSVRDKTGLVLDPDHKRITFHYAALSLYEPQKISFKYQLFGFEDEWVEAGSVRSVSYTNLHSGDYRFRVVASNNDGVWNNIGDSINFRIHPKWWETPFFIALVIVALIGLLYLIYILRVKGLKKKQLVLERIVDKRAAEVLIKNKQLQIQKDEIQKQSEELEYQKAELNIINVSKDKIFSIIAHDLRGPLGNFKTILDLVIHEPDAYDDDERQEMLMMLSENAKSTYDLLDNLLNWSVSQQDAIAFNPESFLVEPVVDDVFSILMPMAIKKEIAIQCKIDMSLSVIADQNMARVIIRNLLSNAIKFTENKGEVTIFAHNKGSFIEFGVRDNGIGISEDEKLKLFDQIKTTIRIGTNLEKGSGLGLMLCKEFVKKNGGEIWVESSKERGSTFYFTLKKAK